VVGSIFEAAAKDAPGQLPPAEDAPQHDMRMPRLHNLCVSGTQAARGAWSCSNHSDFLRKAFDLDLPGMVLTSCALFTSHRLSASA